MGSGLTIFSTLTLITTILAVILGIYVYNGGFWLPKTIPKVEPKWWGPGDRPAKEDASIRPFKIQVPDSVLEDLNRRLDTARLPPPPLEGANFRYGFNSQILEKVLKFWRNDYKWREREAFLNKYPQFKTNIQGLDIHFIHVKPQEKQGVETVPFLLLHGWPGSVREFYSLIERLNSLSKTIQFEIIAPSLPGYGWSSGAAKRGLGGAQMAQIMTVLMTRLGHQSWYVQGGDWGALIGSNMAIMYPERVRGFHSNFCMSMSPVAYLKLFIGAIWPGFVVDAEHQNKMYPLKRVFMNTIEETGYMHIQATKPDTVGTALNDSPAGLVAYILEKFSTWTNPKWRTEPDGGLTKKFTYTDLLDNVMIYWVTGSITTSMRLYAENFSRSQRALQLDYLPITVPTACARFSSELLYQSDSILKDRFPNLVQSHDFEDGGHFAAMELPEVMANDIIEAVGKMQAKKQ